jgi:hypothetical protein
MRFAEQAFIMGDVCCIRKDSARVNGGVGLLSRCCHKNRETNQVRMCRRVVRWFPAKVTPVRVALFSLLMWQIARHEDIPGAGGDLLLHSFLTFALDWGERVALRCGHVTRWGGGPSARWLGEPQNWCGRFEEGKNVSVRESSHDSSAARHVAESLYRPSCSGFCVLVHIYDVTKCNCHTARI